MLITLENFLTRKGIRGAQYLSDPKIISTKLFTLPQKSIIHYLDLSTDNKFPNRNMYLLNGVDDNKKVRVFNIEDLKTKIGTNSLNNRYLAADIRTWRDSHRKTFRIEDILKEPISDNHNASIVNYNPIKDLYKYGSSNMVLFYKINNILNTLASGLKEFIVTDKEKINLITVTLPNEIPGFMFMNKLTTYSEIKLMRVVTDNNLLVLFEWWKWLSDKTRSKSVFKDISDRDSERILMEFTYRGYSIYLKLSTLRGMSSDSKLDSMKKLEDTKNRKFFLVFLMKLQERMHELSLTGTSSTDKVEDDTDPVNYVSDEEYEEKVSEERAEKVDDNAYLEENETKLDDIKKVSDYNKLTVKTNNRTPISDDELFSTDFEYDEDFMSDLDKFDDVGLSSVSERKVITRALGDIKPKEEDVKVEEVEPEIVQETLVEPVPLSVEERNKVLRNPTIDEKVDNFIKTGEEYGIVTPSDIRSIRSAQEKRARLKSPFSNELLNDVSSTKLPEIKLEGDKVKVQVGTKLIDENLLTNKTRAFDKEYVENYLKTDILSMFKDFENGGVIVSDIQVERVQNSVDKYDIYRLDLRILDGGSGPVYIRIPVIDSEGTFMVGGIKNRLRKTKQDLPIRKITSTKVALTSNYGKFFVERTPFKAYDSDGYVIDYIRKQRLENTGNIEKAVPGAKKLNLVKGLPNLYFLLASNFNIVSTKEYNFLFDKTEITNVVSDKDLNNIKKRGRTFIGVEKKTQNLISMDIGGNLFNETKDAPIGKFTEAIGIDSSKIPKQFSTSSVMGSNIPLGVILSYHMGLNTLVSLTNTKYRLIPSNKRVTLEGKEVRFRFKDYSLILDLDTIEKELIFNGINYYRDFIKTINLRAMDSKDVYLSLLEFKGDALYHLKELDFQRDYFLDSITKSVLQEMKEPTEFLELLLRANEMLVDYSYPDINDPEYSRIRGYDRVPGLMYKAVTESIRENKVNNKRGKKVSLDPYKVWNYITQDETKQAREALNPVASISEDEVVTLTGRDGLSTRAVPVLMRRYHENDAGLFSEGTTDSKNVAIVSSLSPYAKIDNVRGMVQKGFDEMTENPGKIFSTAVQMAPFSEFDDQLVYLDSDI